MYKCHCMSYLQIQSHRIRYCLLQDRGINSFGGICKVWWIDRDMPSTELYYLSVTVNGK
jgi:hypothetical protein